MKEFLTLILSKTHLKENFSCGQLSLDNYIKNQAKQDINRDLSVCYILTEKNTEIVSGYYTISGNSIKRDVFPEELLKKLPSTYTDLPAILLGRLAVDKKHQGKKIGELLLIDALKRCFEISQSMGVIAVIVDPIDEKAIQFYAKYGFIRLSNNKMFIPMKTIKDLFVD